MRPSLLLCLGAALCTAIGAAAYHSILDTQEENLAYTTIEGRKIAPAALKGRVVLLNFWATSCGVCKAEMPELAATYRQYQSRGFEVIAVAMQYDDIEKIKRYAALQALPFPLVYDQDGSIARDFGGVRVTPVTFLIDRSGQRVSQTVGIIHFDKLREYLAQVLPKN